MKEKYFIQDEVVHTYPVSDECYIEYENEQLFDTPPKGYNKCEYCFETWRQPRGDQWDEPPEDELDEEPWQ